MPGKTPEQSSKPLSPVMEAYSRAQKPSEDQQLMDDYLNDRITQKEYGIRLRAIVAKQIAAIEHQKRN